MARSIRQHPGTQVPPLFLRKPAKYSLLGASTGKGDFPVILSLADTLLGIQQGACVQWAHLRGVLPDCATYKDGVLLGVAVA